MVEENQHNDMMQTPQQNESSSEVKFLDLPELNKNTDLKEFAGQVVGGLDQRTGVALTDESTYYDFANTSVAYDLPSIASTPDGEWIIRGYRDSTSGQTQLQVGQVEEVKEGQIKFIRSLSLQISVGQTIIKYDEYNPDDGYRSGGFTISQTPSRNLPTSWGMSGAMRGLNKGLLTKLSEQMMQKGDEYAAPPGKQNVVVDKLARAVRFHPRLMKIVNETARKAIPGVINRFVEDIPESGSFEDDNNKPSKPVLVNKLHS